MTRNLEVDGAINVKINTHIYAMIVVIVDIVVIVNTM